MRSCGSFWVTTLRFFWRSDWTWTRFGRCALAPGRSESFRAGVVQTHTSGFRGWWACMCVCTRGGTVCSHVFVRLEAGDRRGVRRGAGIAFPSPGCRLAFFTPRKSHLLLQDGCWRPPCTPAVHARTHAHVVHIWGNACCLRPESRSRQQPGWNWKS